MSRILIVDDEELVLLGLSDFFRSLGYKVECARDLEDALVLLQKARYALVIADIRLTRYGGEGLKVMDEVRRRWPGTRTILLTGLRSSDVEVEAQRRGVDCLLEKPVSLPDLETAASLLLATPTPGFDNSGG
jgi:ATP-dependent Lon protease